MNNWLIMTNTIEETNVIESVMSFGSNFTKDGLIATLIFAAGLLIVSKIVLRIVNRFMKNAAQKVGPEAVTSYNFVNKVIKIVVYAFVFILILKQFTAFEDLSNFMLGASGVISAVIALASQESVANFVGGMFLALTQPFKVGDSIIIVDKGITGTVLDIGLRHTTVKTLDNTVVIIPNSVLNTSVVENRSVETHYTVRLTFGISYDSDVNKAISIIQKHAENHPFTLDLRTQDQIESGVSATPVICANLSDYSVDLRVTVHTKNIADGIALSSDLRLSVKEEFEKEGISIPFPTMQIYQ